MHKRLGTLFLMACWSVFLVAGCGDDDGGVTGDGGVNNNTNTNDGGTSGQDASQADANVNNNNQPVNCDFVPNAADSDGETGPMTGMTEEHNYWRFRVGVPMAHWDTALAAHAQAYVDTCPSGHSSSGDRSDVAGFSYVGENIYYHSSSSADPVAAVSSWASERADYDYGMVVGDVSGVGHYTQIVWDDSTAIGCGVARCSGSWGTIVVCQYGPGGNYTGNAPYGWTANQCVDLDNDDVLQGEDSDDTDRSVH